MVFTVNGTSSAWCSMVTQQCDTLRTIAIEDFWNVVAREFRYVVASLRLSTSTRLNLDFPINGLRNEIVQTLGRFIKPAVEKWKSRRDQRSHGNHDGIYRSPRVLRPFSHTYAHTRHSHLLSFVKNRKQRGKESVSYNDCVIRGKRGEKKKEKDEDRLR